MTSSRPEPPPPTASPVDDAMSRAGRRLAEVEALSGIGSWEWNIATNELNWSEQLCRVYGIDSDSSPKSFEDFLARVHPDDREQVLATVRRAFDTRGSFEAEHRAIWADGSTHTVLGRGHVLLDTDGQPVRMLGSGQDVTEERAAAQEHAAEERRRAAGQARDDALALIAHDLRSPLAVVVGYSQLLERQASGGSVDAEKLMPYLERIDAAARQMTSLLDDLLTDAAAEDAAEPLELTTVDLLEPLRKIGEHHDAISASHAVVVRVPDRPVLAEVNLPKLERALHNLLVNAIKYSPDGGTVTLALESDPDVVRLAVADEGIGIPADDLPRIFERFHRGANVSGLTSGLGLGRISVKRAVDAHGGRVEVESVEGRGTTVTIHLPRRG
jgi:signal transduction histidine kinase